MSQIDDYLERNFKEEYSDFDEQFESFRRSNPKVDSLAVRKWLDDRSESQLACCLKKALQLKSEGGYSWVEDWLSVHGFGIH